MQRAGRLIGGASYIHVVVRREIGGADAAGNTDAPPALNGARRA